MGADPRDSGAPERARVQGVRVLVADDEESMLFFVRTALARLGCEVDAVANGTDALARFEAAPHDVVVLDLKMPGLDGLDVLARIRARAPDAIVLLMTAYGSIPSAVEAMRRGAFTYMTKPFEIDELVLHMQHALARRDAERENRELKRRLDERSAYAGLVGRSPAMRAVLQAIDLLQGADSTVLITGESGTGKELVARAIHAGSRRAKRALVPVSCATISETLADSQLFGYVPGAFTGAQQRRSGLIARAEGGTLFLDEIAELGLATQAKLERFLQEREYLPLGATEAVRADVRVIASTNRDLDKLAQRGEFRRELLYRLDVLPVRVPPLRERREDVPALVAHFAARAATASCSDGVQSFSDDALAVLAAHDWPGNVRELQNVVDRTLALGSGKRVLDAVDLPGELIHDRPRDDAGESEPASKPFQLAMANAELAYLRLVLTRTRGNISEAARLSGLSRGHLHRKLRELRLDPNGFRGRN